MSNQSKRNIRKKLFTIAVLTVSIFLPLWLFIALPQFPGHACVRSWLLQRLVVTQALPPDFEQQHPHAKKAIYVLGGSQKSLRFRFQTAAELYRKGVARRVMVLGRPGITEYDPIKKRNLRNDEWSLKRLEELGVPRTAVESLSLPRDGFFGTFSEAKGVSNEAAKHGYRVLILVSSSYHTKRVLETFRSALKGSDVLLCVYGSEDHPGLRGLVLEYGKFIFYTYFLIDDGGK